VVHRSALHRPCFACKSPGTARQRSHNLALDRNTVPVDFAIESLPEDHLIFGVFPGRWPVFLRGVEPKMHAVEVLKAARSMTAVRSGCCSVPKKTLAEGSLEPLYHVTIVRAVLGQAKELKDLGGAYKANGSVLLHDREGGKPGRDQAILSVGQSESGMGGDFEKEAAVATGVQELVAPRPPQRNAAKHEGPSVVAKLLSRELTLLSNELDGFDLLEASFGDL
jgi:hypothetical protein